MRLYIQQPIRRSIIKDTVHVSQDVPVTSQEPLIDLPFSLSDDDAKSVSDTSLGLSLGDLSGLEDIIDRYKDSVNTDTPLIQFSPNLPGPTQERAVFDQGPEGIPRSEESRFVSRFCANVSSHHMRQTIMINHPFFLFNKQFLRIKIILSYQNSYLITMAFNHFTFITLNVQGSRNPRNLQTLSA